MAHRTPTPFLLLLFLLVAIAASGEEGAGSSLATGTPTTLLLLLFLLVVVAASGEEGAGSSSARDGGGGEAGGGRGVDGQDAHDGTEAQHSYAAHAGLNSTATMYDCDDEEEEISSQPLLPFVGMQFDTLKDARIFYNEYAFKTGFGIHIGASRNSQKKGPTTLIKRVFECVHTVKPGSKADSSTASEGLSNGAASSSKDSWFEMDVTNKRQKNRLLQHDCKAKMIVGIEGNKWLVSHFVAEHTHTLMPQPELVRYYRSHRNIPEEDMDLIMTMHDVNFSTSSCMGMLSRVRGGDRRILPYVKRDVSNVRCINDSDTVDEFEENWQHMIHCFELVENRHLCNMWRTRHTWVPVFFRKCFFPFTSTTGRSEGLNSYFKTFVHPQDSVWRFVQQYEMLQETMLDREDNQAFIGAATTTPLYSRYKIERQAGGFYTRSVFSKFQAELAASTGFVLNQVPSVDIGGVKFELFSNYYEDPKIFTVNVEMEQEIFECSCKFF
ncbi:hypothetical protein D1007_44382 [Hordeum vulgare]|nr:hypothetical protein D1007_44382 [Hordeum vulgare]